MGRQLVQELLDAVFLSRTVHIGNLVLRQAGEIQLDLWEEVKNPSAWWRTTQHDGVCMKNTMTTGYNKMKEKIEKCL